MLAALSAPLEEQAKHLAALRGTEAAREPLYLWLAAHHAYSDEASDGKTMRFAEQARDTLASRRAGKMPHYAWSIRESELEARIFEVLSWAHLRAEDPAEALAAIEEAFRIDPSQDREVQRCTILCEHFPERQEEAFDSAFKYAEFGGFEEIMALPAYKEYLAARKRRKKSDKGWRWSGKAPASEATCRGAEAEARRHAAARTIANSSPPRARANCGCGYQTIPASFGFTGRRSWRRSATISSTSSRGRTQINGGRRLFPPGIRRARCAIWCRSPSRPIKAAAC